jgi:hypothetical protein
VHVLRFSTSQPLSPTLAPKFAIVTCLLCRHSCWYYTRLDWSEIFKVEHNYSFDIALMPQVYSCVPTCGKEFKKSSSLGQHKQSCTAVLELRKKSRQIHKDKGDDAFPSLFGRKQRLQVGIVSHVKSNLLTICIGFNPGHISSGTNRIFYTIY